MTCPKCSGSMKTFDRLGVHVEQCENCRGIFLDHGELEQIVAAEQRYNESPPPLEEYGGRPEPRAPHRGRPDSPGPYRGRPDSPGPYGDPYSRGGYGGGNSDSPGPYGRRRKRSIFEQLFD